jgi:hypothetical protein
VTGQPKAPGEERLASLDDQLHPDRDGQDHELAALAATTRQLAAAEHLADVLRTSRDRQVVALAQQDRPQAALAAAARMTVQGISKITRAAGLSRYRPRAPREEPAT